MQTKTFVRCAFGLAAFVLAASSEAASQDGYLTGKNGLTFYTFDDDRADSGQSACDDQCLNRWPAVPANEATGKDFSSFQRADGTRQLTYRGQPVYYYRYDHKPGDAQGDGMGGLWHALRSPTQPAAKPSTQSNRQTDSDYGNGY